MRSAERLYQPDMAGADDRAHRVGHLLVVHHAGKFVTPDRLAGQQPRAIVLYAEVDD